MSGSSSIDSPWQTPTLIGSGAVLVVLALFGETGLAMALTWHRSATFAHGFLVLPLSLYLLWRCRQRVAALCPRPHPWGLLLLPGLAAGWLLSHLATVQVAEQLVLVTMLPALLWTVLGSAVLRTLCLPLAFLVFAVPLGDSLVPLLQDMTAGVTVAAVRGFGVPVFQEGHWLLTPGATWHVAEACSGLRYLLATLMLGSFAAAVLYQRWPRRLAFIGAAVLLPVLANGLRAASIVLLTYWGQTVPLAAVVASGVHRLWGHLVYGWLLFGGMLALLCWLGRRWQESPDSPGGAAPGRGASAPRPASTGQHREAEPPASGLRLALTATGGVALLALAPLAAHLLATSPMPAVRLRLVAPAARAPWQPLPQTAQAWNPPVVGADAVVTRQYTDGTQAVDVSVAYYTRPRSGAEVHHATQALETDGGWVRTATRQTRAVIEGQPVRVHATQLRSPAGTTRLVWQWYWVGGQWTANAAWAKVLQVTARLRGAPPAAAVITLSTASAGHPAEAAQTFQQLLGHLAWRETLEHVAPAAPAMGAPSLPKSEEISSDVAW